MIEEFFSFLLTKKKSSCIMMSNIYWRYAMTKKTKSLKKEKLVVRIVSAIFLAIAIVLIAVGFSSDDLIFLSLIGFLFLAGALYTYFNCMQRVKRSFCPECGRKYDYEDDIAWGVSDEVETQDKVTAMVEFECTCSHCGKNVNFRKNFVISRYDKQKNAWINSNITQLAKKYFW